MCPKHDLHFITSNYRTNNKVKLPKFERCPNCNRRLKVLSYDCEGLEHNIKQHEIKKSKKSYCLHFYIPAHKPK